MDNIAPDATAQEIAEFLESHPHGSRVLSARLHADYSGRESGPLHRSPPLTTLYAIMNPFACKPAWKASMHAPASMSHT